MYIFNFLQYFYANKLEKIEEENFAGKQLCNRRFTHSKVLYDTNAMNKSLVNSVFSAEIYTSCL